MPSPDNDAHEVCYCGAVDYLRVLSNGSIASAYAVDDDGTLRLHSWDECRIPSEVTDA